MTSLERRLRGLRSDGITFGVFAMLLLLGMADLPWLHDYLAAPLWEPPLWARLIWIFLMLVGVVWTYRLSDSALRSLLEKLEGQRK